MASPAVAATDESPSTLPPDASPSHIDPQVDNPGLESDTDTEDDDPVVAEYDIYVFEPEHPLYILQYVDRPADKPFTSNDDCSPIEMRIKPKSGFVEVDVPLNIHENYDRVKGVRFGEAVRKTKGLGQQSYGPAVGFERAMPRPKRRGAADEDEEMENNEPNDVPNTEDDYDLDKYVRDFDDANEKGHVFSTVTYGGQIEAYEKGKPTYMAGVFKGNQLHLTKVAGFVKLSTEFHHIDASAHLDIVSSRKKPSGGAQEPRSILTSSTAEITQEAAKFYKEAAQEPWERLRYSDQDDPEAWSCFNNRMYLHDTNNSVQLISNMTNEEYVESVSAKKGGRKTTTAERPEILEIEDKDG